MIKVKDIAGAGVPPIGIYEAIVDYTDVRENVGKDGEAYKMLLVRFKLVDNFDTGPVESPYGVFDRFYFRGRSLERLRNLIYEIHGQMPSGDENDEVSEEEIAAMLDDNRVYLTVKHEEGDDGVLRAQVGWTFANDPKKLAKFTA